MFLCGKLGLPELLPAAHCPQAVPDGRVGEEVDDWPDRGVAKLPEEGDARELNLGKSGMCGLEIWFHFIDKTAKHFVTGKTF